MKFKVGDQVIKNVENWRVNDFDSWGRGVGIGVIVTPPFPMDDGEYDVRWPKGRCFEDEDQLKLYVQNENSQAGDTGNNQ